MSQSSQNQSFDMSQQLQQDGVDEEFFEFQIAADLYVALQHEIFAEIISWIPAYPYLYSLRRVCKKWKRELEERIYEQRVELLDLLALDHKRVDEYQGYRNFVNFSEVEVNLPAEEEEERNRQSAAQEATDADAATATAAAAPAKRKTKGKRKKTKSVITRQSVIECLGSCFPNVKTLKFQVDTDMCTSEQGRYHHRSTDFSQMRTLLQQFPLLENLVVIASGREVSKVSTLEFLKELIEGLLDKQHLRRLQIVNLEISNLPQIVDKLRFLGTLPNIEHIDLKYSLYSSGFDQSKFQMDVFPPLEGTNKPKATATISRVEVTDQLALKSYSQYMLEKLRIPLNSLYYQTESSRRYYYGNQWSAVNPMRHALDTNMQMLAEYLLRMGLRVTDDLLTYAFKLKRDDMTKMMIEHLDVSTLQQSGRDANWIICRMIEEKNSAEVFELMLQKLPVQLTMEQILAFVSSAVRNGSGSILAHLVEKYPEVKNQPEFALLLHQTRVLDSSLPIVRFLVIDCGLSFLTPTKDRTFGSYFVKEFLDQRGSTGYNFGQGPLKEYTKYVTKNTKGGLKALFTQEIPDATDSSALHQIIKTAQNSYYHSGMQQNLQSLLSFFSISDFFNLRTDLTNQSFLHIFAQLPTKVKSSGWSYSTYYQVATYMAPMFVQHCNKEEVLQELMTCRNSLFIQHGFIALIDSTAAKDDHGRSILQHRFYEASKPREDTASTVYDYACISVLLQKCQVAPSANEWKHRDNDGLSIVDHSLDYFAACVQRIGSLRGTGVLYSHYEERRELEAAVVASTRTFVSLVKQLPQELRDELLMKNQKTVLQKIAKCAILPEVYKPLAEMEPRFSGNDLVQATDPAASQILTQLLEENIATRDSIRNALNVVKNFNILLSPPGSTEDNAPDSEKMTPLQYAISKGNDQLADTLLEFGTHTSIGEVNRIQLEHLFHGKSALVMACEKGFPTVFASIADANRALLENTDASTLIDACNSGKHYGLLYDVIFKRGKKATSRLDLLNAMSGRISTGRFNSPSFDVTPETLMAWEKDFNVQDNGQGWIDWLSKSVHDASGKEKQPDADKNQDKMDESDDNQPMSPRVLDEDRLPVLFKLCTSKELKSFVQFLMQLLYGERLLSLLLRLRHEQDTVFHYLAGSDFHDVTRMLLEGCGDARKDGRISQLLNMANAKGDTALHIAMQSAKDGVVTALVNHGADTEIKNKARKKPSDCSSSMRTLKALNQASFEPKKRLITVPEWAKATSKKKSAEAAAASSESEVSSSGKGRGRKRKQPEAEEPAKPQPEQAAAATPAAEPAAATTSRRKRIRLDK